MLSTSSLCVSSFVCFTRFRYSEILTNGRTNPFGKNNTQKGKPIKTYINVTFKADVGIHDFSVINSVVCYSTLPLRKSHKTANHPRNPGKSSLEIQCRRYQNSRKSNIFQLPIFSTDLA